MSISDLISRTLADRGGAAGIEFALALPTLTLFVIGMVDLGCAAYQQMEVAAAADAGAMYAIRNGAGNLPGVTAAATSATPMTLSPAPTAIVRYACVSGNALNFVATSTTSCGEGVTAATYVQVSASAPYTPLITWSGLATPATLSAQTLVRIQ
jgi:Flp pilus assembly protein TadG